jgi:hypothetical protein
VAALESGSQGSASFPLFHGIQPDFERTLSRGQPHRRFGQRNSQNPVASYYCALVSRASIAAQTAKPIAEKLMRNTDSKVVKGVECGPQEGKAEGGAGVGPV